MAFGAAAIVVLVPLLLPPMVPSQSFETMPAVGARPASDPRQQVQAAAAPDLRSLCSSPAASGLIKRELFRRAAELRGKDGPAFAAIAGYTLLRFQPPLLSDSSHTSRAVSCKASVALDLPPGVAVSGVQRSLAGTLVYSVHLADQGTKGRLKLTSGGSIVELLATIARTPTEVADPVEPASAPKYEPPVSQPAPVPLPAAAAPAPPKRVRRPSLQNPSFNCNTARTWAARTVCYDANLASLDRKLASQWGDAMARADAEQRVDLLRSDSRFLARRNSCSSEPCVQAAYNTQIREVQLIGAAPPRR
jgi:uncharacterized protein YecT (DUF1311 family)